jgi:hypothetical protein
MIKRKEEREFINQIQDYKKKFRENLKEALTREREEKHKKGDIFFKGYWVSKEKIAILQEKLKKHEFVVFLEIHILFFILLLLNILLWFVFKKFLLP